MIENPTYSIMLGAFIAGVIGIATHPFIKYIDNIITKKHTAKAFLSEIKSNQDLLRQFSNAYTILKSNTAYTGTEDNFPETLSFNRTIYHALADKIGLFNDKCIEMVVRYYGATNNIEEEYQKFELIHNSTISFLIAQELEEATGRANNNFPTYDDILEFFANTEEIFKLGEDLTKLLI